MTLTREELIQLHYMELQCIAQELFDVARLDRGDCKHFGPLLAGCWDPRNQSWDEWLDIRSNCPHASQSFDVLWSNTGRERVARATDGRGYETRVFPQAVIARHLSSTED